jgi:peptidoglycan L-alanyl-D-glutamate endopeptidase CwlK
LMPDGKAVSWDTCRDGDKDGQRDWLEVAAIGKALGFEWGGDWDSFRDMPHFQMVFGLTTAQLRAGAKPPTIIKGDKPKMDPTVANQIIDKYVRPDYADAIKKGDKAGAEEAHTLANELRKASGQPTQ